MGWSYMAVWSQKTTGAREGRGTTEWGSEGKCCAGPRGLLILTLATPSSPGQQVSPPIGTERVSVAMHTDGPIQIFVG